MTRSQTMLAKWMNENSIDPNRYDYLLSSDGKTVRSYQLVKNKWVGKEIVFSMFRQDTDTFVVFSEEKGYLLGFKYIGYHLDETRYIKQYVPFCEKF